MWGKGEVASSIVPKLLLPPVQITVPDKPPTAEVAGVLDIWCCYLCLPNQKKECKSLLHNQVWFAVKSNSNLMKFKIHWTCWMFLGLFSDHKSYSQCSHMEVGTFLHTNPVTNVNKPSLWFTAAGQVLSQPSLQLKKTILVLSLYPAQTNPWSNCDNTTNNTSCSFFQNQMQQ